jgi:type IV pilus assembly protein PilC
MIDAGLSVVSALVILEEQTDDAYLAAITRELRADVEGGLLLSQAMARHPKVFTRLYVSMVEAGEAAGILDIVLDRVAFQIEKATQIQRRVKGAMIYPTMVFVFATLVLTGMLLFLVPVFSKIFAQLNGQLPTLTQIVVDLSNMLRTYWYIIFPLIGAILFGLRRWMRTEQGRRTWDRLKLRIPMKIGDVCLKIAMARFSRTLATLVGSGVDVVKALEITGNTSGNWVIEQALLDVRTKVQEGIPIAQPLLENPAFPPMVSQMIKIGEETGELEKMLGKIADFYEDEVDSSIQSLTSIIEPLMMIGVGFMVGIIIVAMYLPMFKMLTLIGNQ